MVLICSRRRKNLKVHHVQTFQSRAAVSKSIWTSTCLQCMLQAGILTVCSVSQFTTGYRQLISILFPFWLVTWYSYSFWVGHFISISAILKSVVFSSIVALSFLFICLFIFFYFCHQSSQCAPVRFFCMVETKTVLFSGSFFCLLSISSDSLDDFQFTGIVAVSSCS